MMQFTPVLIAGCDRSGTTMLGDMMGSGSASFATPESQWIHEYLLKWQAAAFATPLEAAQWLNGHFRFAVWEMGLSDAALAGLIDLKDPRQSIENILACYLRQSGREPASIKFWCDHTPDSFKYYPLLRAVFPDARYIHIVRDGRAVYQSIKSLDWGPNNAYMASRFWVERVQQGLAVEMSEAENCLRVRYEDIVSDPLVAMKKLCEFTGITFHDEMIKGGGLILPGFTRGQHRLVGRAPDATRLEHWKEVLSHHEVAVFEAYPWCRTLMKQFEYETSTATPVRVTTLHTLGFYVHDFLRYLVHRLRHRRMENRVTGGQASGAVNSKAKKEIGKAQLNTG